jgi:hypothetical protein
MMARMWERKISSHRADELARRRREVDAQKEIARRLRERAA